MLGKETLGDPIHGKLCVYVCVFVFDVYEYMWYVYMVMVWEVCADLWECLYGT